MKCAECKKLGRLCELCAQLAKIAADDSAGWKFPPAYATEISGILRYRQHNDNAIVIEYRGGRQRIVPGTLSSFEETGAMAVAKAFGGAR